MSPPTLGVDVGGTSTRAVTFDANGDVLRHDVTRTPVGPVAVVQHLVAVVRAALDAHPAVDVVGLGMPGRVDPSRGSVDLALNLGVHAPVDVRAAVAGAVTRPVVIENDVNAAAVGAAGLLAPGPRASLCLVSIGTGFATGCVLDGRLHRGATGASGEIGHLPVPGATVACPCGQTGCLEAVASGAAMLRRWGAGAGVAELWDAADAGDATARDVRADAVAAIAWALQQQVLALDPDVVVLAGGVSRLGARLLEPVCDHLRSAAAGAPVLAAADVAGRVRLAPLDVELGALGAARCARATAPAAPVGGEVPGR